MVNFSIVINKHQTFVLKTNTKSSNREIQLSFTYNFVVFSFVCINGFNIHLIPETLDLTNLGQLSKGDLVNIEIDQNTITVVNTVKKTLATKISS